MWRHNQSLSAKLDTHTYQTLYSQCFVPYNCVKLDTHTYQALYSQYFVPYNCVKLDTHRYQALYIYSTCTMCLIYKSFIEIVIFVEHDSKVICFAIFYAIF